MNELIFSLADGGAALGVVPAVANLGTALLPTILAGLSTVFVLLLKPRALVAACRAHPGRVAGTVAALIVCAGIGWWLFAAPTSTEPAPATVKAKATADWPAVAMQILRQRERVAAAGVVTAVSGVPARPADTQPVPTGASATAPVIFRGDPARTGYGGGFVPVGLRALWEHIEEESMILTAPLIANGRVYAASCYQDPPKTFGTVFCLDADSGEVVWSATEAADVAGVPRPFMGFFSSPALSADGRSLVIGQGLHPDKDASLLCFDAGTGALRWAAPTSLHLESSPVIVGDLVVVGAGAIEDPDTHQPTGHPGYVLAVRLADGAEVWRHDLADPESSPVASADGFVYIGSGFNGNAVVALRTDPEDGLRARGFAREAWRVATPYPATGAVTLAGDLVLIGCGNGDFVFTAADPKGTVLAIDRHSGAVRWTRELPDAVLGSIAVSDGVAYVPVRNGELVALDLESGAMRWRQADAGARLSRRGALLAGPAVALGKVYAVSSDGYLGVIDAATGAVLERHFLNDRQRPGNLGLSASSPWVAGGRVWVGSETGGLRCFAGTP